jgi:hypothetical protein
MFEEKRGGLNIVSVIGLEVYKGFKPGLHSGSQQTSDQLKLLLILIEQCLLLNRIVLVIFVGKLTNLRID